MPDHLLAARTDLASRPLVRMLRWAVTILGALAGASEGALVLMYLHIDASDGQRASAVVAGAVVGFVVAAGWTRTAVAAATRSRSHLEVHLYRTGRMVGIAVVALAGALAMIGLDVVSPALDPLVLAASGLVVAPWFVTIAVVSRRVRRMDDDRRTQLEAEVAATTDERALRRGR